MKHLFTLAALLPLAAWAQAPTLTALAPARNAVAAPRTTGVQLTFSQAVTGASGLRVFSNQQRGNGAGTASGDGSSILRFQPRQVWLPGEEVSVSIPATVRGAGTGGTALAAGQVLQFRAAAGPCTGAFTAGTTIVDFSNYYYNNATLSDVDNDGRLDLLYVDPTSNAVWLRPGDGRGSFGAATRTAGLGLSPQDLTLADMNNDGNLDLVGDAWGGNTKYVALSLGDGTGQFSRAPGVAAAGTPIYAQVADVNADGNLDFVYVDHDQSPNPPPFGPRATTLGVALGDGLGGFVSQPALPLTFGSGGLQVADVNNDGYLDCLVANVQAGLVKTYLGNGRGTFALASTPALTIPTSSSSNPFEFTMIPVAADLTGDGKVDLLVTESANNAITTVRLHPGTGLGGFGPATTITVPNLTFVKVADLDGDGDLDLLGVPKFTPIIPRPLSYWRNNGTGTFTAQPDIAGPASQAALGDINNDGTLDVVALDQFGNGNGYNIYPRLSQPLATAPTLASFSPALAPAGTVVTLTGTNFTGATAVLVGGVPVTGFTVVNGSTITFTVPAGSPTGLISVVSPTGMGTSATGLRNGLATRAGAEAFAAVVFPNPAHGTVTVQVPAVAGASRLDMALYNALGQVVRRYPAAALSAAGLSTTVDVSGVAAGLYTLRLMAGGAAVSRAVAVE